MVTNMKGEFCKCKKSIFSKKYRTTTRSSKSLRTCSDSRLNASDLLTAQTASTQLGAVRMPLRSTRALTLSSTGSSRSAATSLTSSPSSSSTATSRQLFANSCQTSTPRTQLALTLSSRLKRISWPLSSLGTTRSSELTTKYLHSPSSTSLTGAFLSRLSRLSRSVSNGKVAQTALN